MSDERREASARARKVVSDVLLATLGSRRDSNVLEYIEGLEADRARLDWLQMHCSGVELRDSAGTERTFEREYFSPDDSFRDFLDQLPKEYERVTEPLSSSPLAPTQEGA